MEIDDHYVIFDNDNYICVLDEDGNDEVVQHDNNIWKLEIFDTYMSQQMVDVVWLMVCVVERHSSGQLLPTLSLSNPISMHKKHVDHGLG
jgi:hypothetical protein